MTAESAMPELPEAHPATTCPGCPIETCSAKPGSVQCTDQVDGYRVYRGASLGWRCAVVFLGPVVLALLAGGAMWQMEFSRDAMHGVMLGTMFATMGATAAMFSRFTKPGSEEQS